MLHSPTVASSQRALRSFRRLGRRPRPARRITRLRRRLSLSARAKARRCLRNTRVELAVKLEAGHQESKRELEQALADAKEANKEMAEVRASEEQRLAVWETELDQREEALNEAEGRARLAADALKPYLVS